MTWDPAQYSLFSQPRLRPALDLLARIKVSQPKTVVDLGCGTGNITRILAERWPQAKIIGVDSSAEMLATARQTPSPIQWVQADAATWEPEAPIDVLFSNAALQWLGDHPRLFPRLAGLVAPGGGVFAIQIPRHYDAPSHQLVAAAIDASPKAEDLRPFLLRKAPVGAMAFYHRLLRPLVTELDIWETDYLHVLTGDHPVVEWMKGTTLRPLLNVLTEPEQEQFLADYTQSIAEAYPPEADGTTLFPFRRLFLVAEKR